VRPDLVGRERERDELAAACVEVLAGRPVFVLLSGEAGVGKTRLAQDVATSCGLRVLAASADPTVAYGPIAGVLRQWLRQPDGDIRSCGPLAHQLAMLLPELGDPPDEIGDGATFAEALRCALESIGGQAPTALVLDDLHQADNATLEVLPALAASLRNTRLLLVGIYRSDEIGAAHPIRRLRSTLRREGTARELHVTPLDAGSIAALIESVLGARPAQALVDMVNGHAQGVPFFAEELTAALHAAGHLEDTPGGVAPVAGTDLPLPVTISDAVMVRTDGMSPAARNALEIAAVVGATFDQGLVTALSDPGTIDEAMDRGLIVEEAPGHARFRHALVRDAVYAGIPWTRRRSIHCRIAQALESQGAPAGMIAEHWIAAREGARARSALRAAVNDARRLHAHRDAIRACQRALEFWPEGDQEQERVVVLEDLGECAQLSGDLGEAARAWREVVERRRRSGDVIGMARAHRRLAGVYALEGSPQRSVDAWLAAASAFAACESHADAAQCRLAAAALLHYSGRVVGALEAIVVAAADVERSARTDMQLRALTLEGVARGKLGQTEAALELVSTALARSLAGGLTASAADAYSGLAVVLENAGDYAGAQDAYTTAIDFCDARGIDGVGPVCIGCLAHLLRQTGDWRRAAALCRDVLERTSQARPRSSTSGARYTAKTVLAMLHTCRGELRPAKDVLTEAASTFGRLGVLGPDMEYLGARGRLAELEAGSPTAAVDSCVEMLERFEAGDDIHYSVQHLRWAAGIFSGAARIPDTHRCGEALARIASAAPNQETLAALATGLGEIAVVEGDVSLAEQHYERAVELMRTLPLPFDRAETQFRAGRVAMTAGNAKVAAQRFNDAYLTARRLGARPLAASAHAELTRSGGQVNRRPHRRVVTEIETAELTPREVAVVRLVAEGRTNREIAAELFVSQRTVDMHVRNALARLDCRSRADAVRRAAELGLLAGAR